MSDETEDIFTRNAELDDRLANDPHIIDRLVEQARVNRFVSRLALTLVVAVIFLGGIVGAVIVRQQSTADEVSDNSAAIAEAKVVADATARATIVACELGNDARAGQKELWDYLLNFPTQVGQGPEQDERKAAVRAIVDRIFNQRECIIPLDPTPAPTTTEKP